MLFFKPGINSNNYFLNFLNKKILFFFSFSRLQFRKKNNKVLVYYMTFSDVWAMIVGGNKQSLTREEYPWWWAHHDELILPPEEMHSKTNTARCKNTPHILIRWYQNILSKSRWEIIFNILSKDHFNILY